MANARNRFDGHFFILFAVCVCVRELCNRSFITRRHGHDGDVTGGTVHGDCGARSNLGSFAKLHNAGDLEFARHHSSVCQDAAINQDDGLHHVTIEQAATTPLNSQAACHVMQVSCASVEFTFAKAMSMVHDGSV